MNNVTQTITTAPILDLILRLSILAGFIVIIGLVVVFVVRFSRLEKAGIGGVEFDTDEKPVTRKKRRVAK